MKHNFNASDRLLGKDELDNGVFDQHGPQESCAACTTIFLGVKPYIITKIKKFPGEF